MPKANPTKPIRRPITESRAILLGLMRRPDGMSEAEGSAVLGWKRCDGTILEVWNEQLAAGVKMRRWKGENGKSRFAVVETTKPATSLEQAREAVRASIPAAPVKSKLHRAGLDKTMLRMPVAAIEEAAAPVKRGSIQAKLIDACSTAQGATSADLRAATGAKSTDWKAQLEAAARKAKRNFEVRKVGAETRYFLIAGEGA